MGRVMRYLAVVVLLLLSSSAHASEGKLQDIPPGQDLIVSIQKGEQAPFTGQLFNVDTAMRWGNWLMQYKHRLTLDVDREKRLCAAELKYQHQLLSIEEEKSLKLTNDLKGRLMRSEKRNALLQDDINHPSFWDSIEFGLVLGVVGSAAIAIATGFAAN